MRRDRRSGDGVVVRGTDDDGRGRDFVDDNRRDLEMDFFVGDYSDGSRLALFVCLLSDCDCDFVGDSGGRRDLVSGLAVPTGFVIVIVVGGGIVLGNGIDLLVGIEVQEFVVGIVCLRLIFVCRVRGTGMSVDFVSCRLWVFVNLWIVVNLVQAGLDLTWMMEVVG